MPARKHKLPRNVHIRNDGAYEIRVTYVDDEGVRRSLHEVTTDITPEYVQTRVGAMKDAIDRKRRGADMKPIPVMFKDIVKRYVAEELVEPVYRDGRKIAGKKSLPTLRGFERLITREFGHRNPRGISYSDLKAFKMNRINSPVEFKYKTKLRSIATVNREMAFLRSVLNFAVREGWIDKNPFNAGPTLIKLSDEQPRESTITQEEEEALLAGCTGKLSHLRPIVTCILYGGFRRGELLQLHWSDVSFNRRTITLRSEMTKTNRSRVIPMHNRVIDALRWCENRFGDDERVIPINDIKNAWGTLRNKINRPDLHLHDLRATFATRLLNNGVPLHIVQVLMGHTTSLITLKHYSRPDETLLQKAIETLPDGFWTVQEIREVMASSSLRS